MEFPTPNVVTERVQTIDSQTEMCNGTEFQRAAARKQQKIQKPRLHCMRSRKNLNPVERDYLVQHEEKLGNMLEI